MGKISENLVSAVTANTTGSSVDVAHSGAWAVNLLLSGTPASGSATVEVQALFGASTWKKVWSADITSSNYDIDAALCEENPWRALRGLVSGYSSLQTAGAEAVAITLQLEGARG